jgi:hypothetical protein
MVTASVTNPLRGDKAWAYLERQKTIRLASLNEDGSIYLSPTWYVVEDQKMYLPFDAASRHGDNALSNRKIAGLVDAGDEFVTVSGLRIMGHLEQVTDDAADPSMLTEFEPVQAPEIVIEPPLVT